MCVCVNRPVKRLFTISRSQRHKPLDKRLHLFFLLKDVFKTTCVSSSRKRCQCYSLRGQIRVRVKHLHVKQCVFLMSSCILHVAARQAGPVFLGRLRLVAKFKTTPSCPSCLERTMCLMICAKLSFTSMRHQCFIFSWKKIN